MTVVQRSSNRIPAETRRQEILDRATDLLVLHGFDQTTMDDVALAANITKRTLYRYMASKEDLLFEIHDSFTVNELLANDVAGDEPIERLTDFIARHIRMVADHPKAIRVFFEERKHLSGDRAKQIEKRRDAYESVAVSIIRAGIDRHDFVDINPRAAAQAILGSMTEMYLWYRPDGSMTVEDITDITTDCFLHGSAVNRGQALPPVQPLLTVKTAKSTGAGRQKVLDAAITSFARAGYHGVSMRDLAEVASVTKGAVMYHAGYKQDLLEAIHKETFSASIALLTSVLEESAEASSVETLAALIRNHMEFVARNGDAISVINENMRYLDPAAHRRIQKLNRKWLDIFRTAISNGIESGDIRSLDLAFLTRTLVGMFNSAARWYNPRGSLRPPEMAELFLTLYLHGLLQEGTPQATRRN